MTPEETPNTRLALEFAKAITIREVVNAVQ